jgi:hypothetical protein
MTRRIRTLRRPKATQPLGDFHGMGHDGTTVAIGLKMASGRDEVAQPWGYVRGSLAGGRGRLARRRPELWTLSRGRGARMGVAGDGERDGQATTHLEGARAAHSAALVGRRIAAYLESSPMAESWLACVVAPAFSFATDIAQHCCSHAQRSRYRHTWTCSACACLAE